MTSYEVRPIGERDKEWIRAMTIEHWAGPTVVSHGEVYHPENQRGFVVEAESKLVGALTYDIEGGSLEIVTIFSSLPNQGVGTALIEKVKEAALAAGCWFLWLVTTNDNLDALRFFQKRGFVLAALNKNALEVSRKIKPEIPEIGKYGIPLRDEFELEMSLD